MFAMLFVLATLRRPPRAAIMPPDVPRLVPQAGWAEMSPAAKQQQLAAVLAEQEAAESAQREQRRRLLDTRADSVQVAPFA
jgi:hypothetical protein